MAALVDARIRLLIDGYELRIADLQDEIWRLESKVDALTNALEEKRTRGVLGL
jgi:DNA anti-recombination protein RmuC